jgi:hypothetical protein
MSIVDDRGRVAGRVNLIDAFAALIILVMIPLAYGGYLLFRSPPAKLVSVAPDRMYQGPNMRLEIIGTNLRPFMRVAFNTIQGRTFMIGSTRYAQVELPDLAPGTYDVQLFDSMQQVDVLPKGLTILPLAPPPTIEMEVAGSFQGLPDAWAKQIKVGDQFPPGGNPPTARVVAIGRPLPARLRVHAGDAVLGVPVANATELTATLRVNCSVVSSDDGSARCQVSGPQHASTIGPDAVLALPGANGWMNFQISDVHLTTDPAVAQARVRFLATPEVAAKIQPGDTDRGPQVFAQRHAATIVAVTGNRTASAAEAGSRPMLGGSLRVVDVTIRVPIEQGAGGWLYRQEPFKAGAQFSFETPQYVVNGEVTDVTWPALDREAVPK